MEFASIPKLFTKINIIIKDKMNIFDLKSFNSCKDNKIMDKKCNEYQAIFTFRTDEELREHIKNCEDCAHVQDTMDKVSELIQEVKPYYKKKKSNIMKLKAACALFIMLIGGGAIGLYSTNPDISDTIKYGTVLSAEDLGFPVDSYGLISVE